MAASYPGAVKTFAARSGGQTIDASHINDLQDEVSAIEAGLLNGTAPVNSSRITAPALSVSAGSTLTTLSVFGGSTFAGQITATAQPRASAYASAAQSVNNDTETALTLDTEDFDVGGLHSTSVNSNRMTIASGGDGLYAVTGQATFAANATGYRALYVRVNGAQVGQVLISGGHSAATVTILNATALVSLVATDYVELAVRHTAGAALNVGGGTRSASNILQIVKLW